VPAAASMWYLNAAADMAFGKSLNADTLNFSCYRSFNTWLAGNVTLALNLGILSLWEFDEQYLYGKA
jgi:hypothetical protein